MRDELQKESLAEILNFMDSEKERSDILSKAFFTNMYDRNIYDMAHEIREEFDYKSQCTKDYSWYLQKVHKGFDYTFFKSPNFVLVGEIQLTNNEYCLHCPQFSSEGVLAEVACRHRNIVFWDSHMFGFGKDGAVYTSNPDMLCWDAGNPGEGARITQYICHTTYLGEVQDNQRFVYDEQNQQIRHPSSGRCVELVRTDSKVEALLMKCSTTDFQKWSINKPSWIE